MRQYAEIRTITMVYLPLNNANSNYGHYMNSCPLGNVKTEIFSLNFAEILTAIRRHVKYKIYNSCLFTFAVTALGTLLIAISVIYLCPFCHLKTCLVL